MKTKKTSSQLKISKSKNHIKRWEASGLLEGILPENKQQLASLLDEGQKIVADNYWEDEKLFLPVVIRRMYSLLAQPPTYKGAEEKSIYERFCSNNEARLQAIDNISGHLYKMAETLADMRHYIALGEKYFHRMDWEAEMYAIYSKNQAYYLWDQAKEKLKK